MMDTCLADQDCFWFSLWDTLYFSTKSKNLSAQNVIEVKIRVYLNAECNNTVKPEAQYIEENENVTNGSLGTSIKTSIAWDIQTIFDGPVEPEELNRIAACVCESLILEQLWKNVIGKIRFLSQFFYIFS